MSYINTPSFPVISWDVTIQTPIVITLRGDFGGGPVTSTVTVTAGTYKGFNTNSLGRADAGSLWGDLGFKIQAELQNPAAFNQVGALVFVEPEWRTNVSGALAQTASYLAHKIRITGTAAPVANFEIEFPSDAVCELYGVEPASVGGSRIITFPFLVSPLESFNDMNSAGYWAPYQLSVVETRDIQTTVFANQRLSGGGVDVVRWGDDRERSVMTFPYVFAAYIWAYRAERTEFAGPADRYTYDPNNLLETLKEVATQTGVQDFFLFQDNGARAEITLPEAAGLQNFEALITEDVSGNGQLLQVTIPHNIVAKSGGFV
jgi:hypothetical protein